MHHLARLALQDGAFFNFIPDVGLIGGDEG